MNIQKRFKALAGVINFTLNLPEKKFSKEKKDLVFDFLDKHSLEELDSAVLTKSQAEKIVDKLTSRFADKLK